MSLLAEIGEALRGALDDDVFPAATLHAVASTLDVHGQEERSFTDYPCHGFAGDWEAKIVLARGYDANAARIVLVQSPTLPELKAGDEVTATRPILEATQRYRITHVTSDPADATWQVAGVAV